jgi:hypothetical protein
MRDATAPPLIDSEVKQMKPPVERVAERQRERERRKKEREGTHAHKSHVRFWLFSFNNQTS